MMWFNYIFSLFIPTIFILIGYTFWKHAPKKINGTAGWRTKQALTNQETWDFANALGGKCTLILGCVEFLASLIFLLFTLNLNEDIVSLFVLVLVVIQSACFAIVYRYVESRLKTTFS